MKILHINTHEWGGAAIAVNRLHKALLRNNVDSTVLYLNRSGLKTEGSQTFLLKAKNLLLRVLYKYKLKAPLNEQFKTRLKKYNNQSQELFSLASTDFDITKHSAYQDSDIIHLHWVTGFLDYSTFFKNNTKPILWTLHDENPFTGVCHYSGECIQYLSECSNCPVLKPAIVKKSFKEKAKSIAFQNKMTIVTPSNWLKEKSSHSKLFKNYLHYHISNGLDVTILKPYNKQFAREVFEMPFDKKIFLFVCDDISNTRKGFSILVNAISEISNENVLFYAVGYAKETPSRIKMLGNINDERLLAIIYSAADAFILPSIADNLPNTMLESMACGTPVIAFPIGGIPDAVKHGITGILCTEQSPESLRNAIISFIDNKFDFDCNKIREYVVQNFNIVTQAQKYQELYKQLLESNELS
jgi:glycosyltransferase involved in cell wall biosynthesis